MATSLLPYINENSSETAIFEAILRRAKGATISSISNLFTVILRMGINSARAKVDGYKDALTTKDKLVKLVSEYPQYHLPKNEVLFWSFFMRNMESVSGIKHHEDYERAECEVLFSVLAITNPVALEDAGFDISKEVLFSCLEYSKEDFNIKTRDMKSVQITQKDSEILGFSGFEEFKAFVCFRECYNLPTKVFPVEVKIPFKESAYTAKYCSSPYKEKPDET